MCGKTHSREVIHSFVRRDVTWLIHVCCVMYMKWLIHVCEVMFSHVGAAEGVCELLCLEVWTLVLLREFVSRCVLRYECWYHWGSSCVAVSRGMNVGITEGVRVSLCLEVWMLVLLREFVSRCVSRYEFTVSHACDVTFSYVWHSYESRGIHVRYIVLQCVAVCCSVLRCVAVCCSVLQCVAVYCSVLQWILGVDVRDYKSRQFTLFMPATRLLYMPATHVIDGCDLTSMYACHLTLYIAATNSIGSCN